MPEGTNTNPDIKWDAAAGLSKPFLPSPRPSMTTKRLSIAMPSTGSTGFDRSAMPTPVVCSSGKPLTIF